MRILFVSSEVHPFAKTGGLADVSGSLPRTLARSDNEVSVVTPLYRTTVKNTKQIKNTGKKLSVEVGGKKVAGEIWTSSIGKNATVYFLKNDGYYDREGLYGNEKGDWPDNLERFTFLSKGALELCKTMNLKPEVIHCHDWQTALIPTYLKTTYKEDPLFKETKSVFTIHNLSYQGLFEEAKWNITGLDRSYFTPKYLEFWGKVNLLKGGLVFADAITAVSVKYSQEIQTKEFGCGLEGLLKECNYKLTGITNGANYDEWDPSKDPFIIVNYNQRSPLGKSKCKESLQKKFGFKAKENTPVIGMITRIIDQKGFDILIPAMEEILKKDLQFILLGTGEQSYHEKLLSIQKKYPQKFGLEIAYNNKLAHQIEAGADMFLMPSRFEPCGLNQLYSLKYGTIPIVSPVGGLDDTIKNYNPKTGEGNGFKMEAYSKEALIKTLNAALTTFKDKNAWKKLKVHAMGLNYSWENTAKQYIRLFEVIQNTIKKNNHKVMEIHPTKNLEA